MNLLEFKKFYESLDAKFEGYIQLSDSKDFIILLSLWDGDRSINIRQINNGFAKLDVKISDFKKDIYEITHQTFLVNAKFKNTKINRIKMTQIWQENADDLCCGFAVLEPQFLLFSGFERGENNG